MSQLLRTGLVILAIAIAGSTAAAGAEQQPAAPADKSPVAPIAGAVSSVTGLAISPLLGTAVYGAYQYVRAPDDTARQALPWYAQVKFWLPALLLVSACAAKDALGAVVPPGLKKPLDVLETLENKVSGLVVAGAVVPISMNSLSHMLLSQAGSTGTLHLGGLAMLPAAAINTSWLLNILTVPFGIAMFAVVWMASHAITVLILLSPWGAIDAALKSARTALLGLLTLTSAINPWVGAVLSLVVIVIAWFVAGWAFRLTTFGSIFCWDFLTRRRKRFEPQADGNRMFSSGNLSKVPIRTYGRLVRNSDNRLEFAYRPWLVLAERRNAIPEGSLAVGRGLFFSRIESETGAVLTLPPRYRGHEEKVAEVYRLAGGVHPAGLRKAWSAMGDLFGRRAAKPA